MKKAIAYIFTAIFAFAMCWFFLLSLTTEPYTHSRALYSLGWAASFIFCLISAGIGNSSKWKKAKE